MGWMMMDEEIRNPRATQIHLPRPLLTILTTVIRGVNEPIGPRRRSMLTVAFGAAPAIADGRFFQALMVFQPSFP